MKPIIYKTEMVRAILAGNKTQTRRPIKDKDIIYSWDCEKDGTPIAFIEQETGDIYPPTYPAPYQPGDILWVRETWRKTGVQIEPYQYKATEERLILMGESGDILCGRYRYRPSIHMPREVARLFLRVKKVWVERAQDITDEGAKSEGANFKNGKNVGYEEKMNRSARDRSAEIWASCYAAPRPVKHKGVVTRYESFPWEDVQESREHKGLPWYVMGNPWVWVTEFEQVSKEKAENGN